MKNIKLSTEDIEILTLEKKKQELDAIYSNMPNCAERDKLWKKSWDLMVMINAMIYNSSGMYRTDKRHLLRPNSGSLNLHLLDSTK